MTSTAHAPAHGTTHGSAHGPGDAHAPHRNYVQIWGILCALLVVSVVGPMLGIRWVMLITAFGVALVKAYMVAKNFMHLDIEKPIVSRTPSSTHAISVRGCRRSQSPRHATAGTSRS